MTDILQFARPEDMGIHPSWIENYTKAMNRIGYMSHSFLLMRHNKVVAEGYWKPFHKDWLHRQYSVSKTFGSAAIGMLVDDGKLKLTDKIADYFTDLLPENPHPWILEMTVRDLLMMATCHEYTTYTYDRENWIKTFFQPQAEPDHRAGTEFRYDTSASYTLDVLIERLTGKTFLEFLKDRCLREIGFSEDAWCVEAPEGHAWGGSGVECTTRDLARFAMLFHNKGVLNGKRYLSEEYIREATSAQIDNSNAVGADTAAEGHGYGYQIWRTWKNTYSFVGMGGQLAISIPDKDILFVCNSDSQGERAGYQDVYENLWAEVIDKIASESLERDDASYAKLCAALENLEVPVPQGSKTSPLAEKINGVTYTLEENPMGIRSFEIRLEDESGKVCYHTDRGDKVFSFKLGAYEDTIFPETHYYGNRIGFPANRNYRCLNAAVWKDEGELLVRTFVIDDYFGNMSAVFTFAGDTVKLEMTKAAEWFLDEYTGATQGKC